MWRVNKWVTCSNGYLHVAETLGAILHEQLLDEVLGDGVHVPRPVDLAGEDLLVDAERVVVEERRVPGEHFVNQNPCRRGEQFDETALKWAETFSSDNAANLPNAHQSTALLWPLDWIISGARYSGVPHSVHVLVGASAKRKRHIVRYKWIWITYSAASRWARGNKFLPVGELLGKAKIGNLQVAVSIEQQVLGLQVAVHNVLRVKVVEGADYLARVKVT